MTLAADCSTEVDEFHRFVERWFAGTIDDPRRLEASLAPDFHIVTPQGTIRTRDGLVEDVVGTHAAYADVEFEITIGAFEPRDVTDDRCLATYEERRSIDDRHETRVATALFRRADAPNGVEWVHVHETGVRE